MAHANLPQRSILLLSCVLASVASLSVAQPQPKPQAAAQRQNNTANDPDFYVGMWVTQDGHIRH